MDEAIRRFPSAVKGLSAVPVGCGPPVSPIISGVRLIGAGGVVE